MAKKTLRPLRLLEDEPTRDHGYDLLGLRPFAEVVSSVAVGTTGPFTIGVYGDWGHGKTSLLRQAKSLIDTEADQRPGTVTVWFNAWQYEREAHPIVPLLATIASELTKRQLDIERGKGAATKAGKKALSGLKRTSRAIRAMAYGFSASLKFGAPGVGEIEAGFVAKEMIDRDEELGARESATDPLLQRSLYFNAFGVLSAVAADAEGERAQSSGRPHVVVFVDDLDRCSPAKAIHLLENVKLALAQPGFVFVLGVAHRIVEGHIQHRYKHEYGVEEYDEGARYLDKIVQLPLHMPSHRERFENYIDTLIAGRMGWLDEATRTIFGEIKTLLRIGSRNSPRALVRLINNLLVDSRLFESFSLGEDEGAQLSPQEFLRVAAVSRSLRANLSERVYDTLARSQMLCGVLRMHGVEDLRKNYESKTIEIEPPDTAARQLDPSNRVGSAIVALERLEFVNDLVKDEAAQMWLKEPEVRQLVDEFFAKKRERPDEGDRALIDAAIRHSFGLSDGTPISQKHRETVTVLDLSDTSVTDVRALSGLSNLHTLDLRDTSVTDVRALSGLKSLEWLSLEGTGVTDVRALSGLSNLERLDLQGTAVSDASVLSSLSKLLQLNLEGTSVTDVRALSGLNKLQTLDLKGANVTDVRVLSGLSNLVWLSLEGTGVTDVSVLSRLNSLERLDLRGTGVTDVSPLSGQSNLHTLDLKETSVTDVRALSGLKSLEWLSLEGTGVTDVRALSGLSNLGRLSLEGTGVTDVSALSGLSSLWRLNLRRTGVTDVSALAGLSSLEWLDLQSTGVTNVGALSELNKLEWLGLQGTGVTDVSALAGIKGLQINQ